MKYKLVAAISLLIFALPAKVFCQEAVKVFVEEVRIPIAAKDSTGRFDPTVGLDDLMVRENGVVQPIKSVYRMPANVLLLLDTGGELNLAKSVRLTREVAGAIVSSLRPDDQIAVMQVSNKAELLRPWTTNQSDALKSLDNLLPGKRSALLKGLTAAVEQFENITPGNSHLVLMSDGIDENSAQTDLTDAFRAILKANITLHVISYATLGMKAPRPSPTRPRVKSAVDPNLIEALPSTQTKEDPTPDLKSMMKHKGGTVLDIDMLFHRGPKSGELIERQQEFYAVTEETGGNMLLPATTEEMVSDARALAQDMDSQYVISYKPVAPLKESSVGEYRKLEVISRRVGLTVRSRRGYVVKTTP
jgi:VWFA-related protein